MIVDAHAHVARVMSGFRKPLRYGRVREFDGSESQFFPPSFEPVASPPDLLLGHMDLAGVDRAFLVQHHLYGDQNVTVVGAVKQWPDRFAGFVYLGGMGQSEAPDQLERWIDAGLLGLKIELPTTRRLRPEFRWDGAPERRIWQRLEKLNRPLWVDVNGCDAEDVAALGRALDDHPGIRLMVCHVGGAPQGIWRERALLAKRANGWVDLAALPLLIGPDEEYPFAGTHDVIRWAVEQFGAERVLWGTDYPPALNRATYRQLLDSIRRHCPFLTDRERGEILGGAAQRVLEEYGLSRGA